MLSLWLLTLLFGSALGLRAGMPAMRVQEGIKLATDIKGNPIWDLRVATGDDAAAIAKLTGGRYTSDVLAPLLSGKTCIVGESGNEIVTAALVTTYKGVKSKEKGLAGGLEDRAELLSVVQAEGLPAVAGTWRRQTALGALKTLKGSGFSDVISVIPADDKAGAEFLSDLGMQESAAGDMNKFSAMLLAMNPDPQKRIK